MSALIKNIRFGLTGGALLAILMLLASGVGYRNEWWDLGLAFNLISYSFFAAATIATFSAAFIVANLLRKNGKLDIAVTLALVVTLACGGYIYNIRSQAYSLPPIHDITTDINDVPQFDAIVPLRANAPNPLEYGGSEIAEQQQKAYPEVKPVITGLNKQQAFDRAVNLAKSYSGWELVDSDLQEGRIEVTVTTFWFGFKDDVVIRIQKTGAGTRLDLRSISRLGKGDLGANAYRIIRFIEDFESKKNNN